MKKKVEYLYDKDNILKVIINIKKGFLGTSGYLLFSIFMLPVGLFIILDMLLEALSLKLFQWPLKDILLMLFVAGLAVYIGCMSLYQWIRYNFGKEVLILNNKDKSLKYQQLVLGFGKIRVFDYCNISKIIAESEDGRYEEYYCCLIHQEKKFKFGIVNGIKEGNIIAMRINDFIIR
ncbi:hypothetical protein [Clostridium sporogenes]|uniref:hypothetical protein n=1 Tax=Clostridium sporogenes TaxID=1509 RepID=UPI0013D4E49A|nr:hypothetical protein [Clostridium sporogenes]NFP91322.1 hypothetical protein [Clostridium sporogenes]